MFILNQISNVGNIPKLAISVDRSALWRKTIWVVQNLRQKWQQWDLNPTPVIVEYGRYIYVIYVYWDIYIYYIFILGYIYRVYIFIGICIYIYILSNWFFSPAKVMLFHHDFGPDFDKSTTRRFHQQTNGCVFVFHVSSEFNQQAQGFHMNYHLVIWHSSGKSIVNGGFNGKSSVNGQFSIAMLY